MRRIFVTAIIALIAALATTAQVVFIQNSLMYTALDDSNVKVGKIDDNHKPKGENTTERIGNMY